MVLKGESLGEGVRVFIYLPLCAIFLLIGSWWSNTVERQEYCAQPEVAVIPLGRGLSSCRRTQRYCYIYSLKKSQDPAPLLHYCFDSYFFVLHVLASLISNCLHLPFETQGRSWRLNETYLLNKKWGHRKGLYPGGPHRILLSFIKNPKVLDWIQNDWEIITHTHIDTVAIFIQRLEVMDTSGAQKVLVSEFHPPLSETRADSCAWAGKVQSELGAHYRKCSKHDGNMLKGRA